MQGYVHDSDRNQNGNRHRSRGKSSFKILAVHSEVTRHCDLSSIVHSGSFVALSSSGHRSLFCSSNLDARSALFWSPVTLSTSASAALWRKANPTKPSANSTAPATISQTGYPIDERAFVISCHKGQQIFYGAGSALTCPTSTGSCLAAVAAPAPALRARQVAPRGQRWALASYLSGLGTGWLLGMSLAPDCGEAAMPVFHFKLVDGRIVTDSRCP